MDLRGLKNKKTIANNPSLCYFIYIICIGLLALSFLDAEGHTPFHGSKIKTAILYV